MAVGPDRAGGEVDESTTPSETERDREQREQNDTSGGRVVHGAIRAFGQHGKHGGGGASGVHGDKAEYGSGSGEREATLAGCEGGTRVCIWLCFFLFCVHLCRSGLCDGIFV